MVEERFRLRTRDAERARGATDGTDGGRLVGRGSSVDRHSQYVRQLALHYCSEESGDGVCSRAQVTFYREPGHLPHLAGRVEVCGPAGSLLLARVRPCWGGIAVGRPPLGRARGFTL